MNDEEIQKIVEENSKNFKLLISDKIFEINKIKVFQNENPFTEPTTRGGVYFSDTKDTKIQATVFNTDGTATSTNMEFLQEGHRCCKCFEHRWDSMPK